MAEAYIENEPIGIALRRRSEKGKDSDPLLSVTQERGVVQQEDAGRRNVSSRDKSAYWRVYPGDIVYNTMRMWQGASARSESFGIVSPAYTVCEPLDRADSRYLAYLLKQPENIAQFLSRSQGIVSDTWNLRFNEFKKIHVMYIADKARQSLIASILATLDEVIQQSDRLIAKLQMIKGGLMHDLFTRGIMPNGELRPPRVEAPYLYKESPAGWIPKVWEPQSLSSVGIWASGGTPSKARPDFWNGSVPWVSPKDMKKSVLEATQDGITENAVSAGAKVVPGGTVLIVVRGMILAHTFPVCICARSMAFNQDVKAVIPRSGVSGQFLAYWLSANEDRMLSLTTESTHGTKRIDQRDLFRVSVGLPGEAEQNHMVSILRTMDQTINRESNAAAKQLAFKSGLMSDLLTGRVRVPESTLRKASAAG